MRTNASDDRVHAELCADPERLAGFLRDLVQVIHLQAKEIERLTTHVEQHTTRLLAPSTMPVVVSELSALHEQLEPKGATKPQPDSRAIPAELRGQRVPTKDMDDLC